MTIGGRIIGGAALALVVAFANAAWAQETAKVHFSAGATSATVNGTIIGDQYIDYVLGARAGQTMSASIKVAGTNGDGTIYFNILPPGSDGEAIFNGSMSADGQASVKLPKDGDYRIRVYLMGNDKDADKTVGFSVKVGIR